MELKASKNIVIPIIRKIRKSLEWENKKFITIADKKNGKENNLKEIAVRVESKLKEAIDNI